MTKLNHLERYITDADTESRPSVNQLAQQYADGLIDHNTYRYRRTRLLNKLAAKSNDAVLPPETKNAINTPAPHSPLPRKENAKLKWLWITLTITALAFVILLGMHLKLIGFFS